ncbi:MAG: response regulator [Nitrospirae bacterium]|nr:response regulator [Nitrospirota bacterium]
MKESRYRILCVDDEQSNLKLLDAILLPRGFEVVKASNGKEAMLIVLKEKIDLMLLDVMMPEMNGFEVCRTIRDVDEVRHIPVVLITALHDKMDRIKGIEAGADDFVSKPFDKDELLARVNMLLTMRNLNARLNTAYEGMKNITQHGRELLKHFDPLNFDLIFEIDRVVNKFLRIEEKDADKPQMIIVGAVIENYKMTWYVYEALSGRIEKRLIDIPYKDAANLPVNSKALFFNEDYMEQSGLMPVLEKIPGIVHPIENIVCYIGSDICFIALNYGRMVGSYDATVLDSFVFQTLLLKAISGQIKAVEDAFEYVVKALARASEANDEDTGNHILRVAENCVVLAEKLGCDNKFINEIRFQAIMHDVGKISIPSGILKKPGKLTEEEFEEMKKHPLYGAKILGDHPMLKMAKVIALTHHEKWDGSGYPYGFVEKMTPIEGRIMAIADIYDALRNARVYKPAFDHEKTCRIILEGDGRTMPSHFDPAVLKAFEECAPKFKEIYERLKD